VDRSKETRPIERPFFFTVGVMALANWIGFSALILLNIAVIGRDRPIIMAVTFVVLVLAFVWEVVHRRRKALRASQEKQAPQQRSGVQQRPAGQTTGQAAS